MNWRDLQLFIPGWNLVYYFRDWRDWNKAQLQFRVNSEEDLAVMRCYIIQRDRALSRLDFEEAANYHDRCVNLVSKRINDIRTPFYKL